MYTSRWSWRFSPTPGRSATTSTPSPPSSLAAPTPESWSSWGVLIAPPHRTTSAARTVRPPRPRREYSSPTCRLEHLVQPDVVCREQLAHEIGVVGNGREVDDDLLPVERRIERGRVGDVGDPKFRRA